MKLSFFLCFMAFALSGTSLSSQVIKGKLSGCEQSYWKAVDLYYSGRYEKIPVLLDYCLYEFGKEYRDYGDQYRVYQVYKLIINSYFYMDLDYKADEYREDLFNYFHDYDPREVMARLEETKI